MIFGYLEILKQIQPLNNVGGVYSSYGTQYNDFLHCTIL